MYRAKSPLDNLDAHEAVVALPRPKLAVGTRVTLRASPVLEEDKVFYRETILRQVLADTRAVVNRLQKQGYMSDMKGRKMPEHNKGLVRQMLKIMAEADSVEVAGHEPRGMHAVGTVGNQCYLRSGSCHSGVDYKCFLLFRKRDEGGRELVYVHPHAVVSESSLMEVRVAEPAATAAA